MLRSNERLLPVVCEILHEIKPFFSKGSLLFKTKTGRTFDEELKILAER